MAIEVEDVLYSLSNDSYSTWTSFESGDVPSGPISLTSLDLADYRHVEVPHSQCK